MRILDIQKHHRLANIRKTQCIPCLLSLVSVALPAKTIVLTILFHLNSTYWGIILEVQGTESFQSTLYTH